MGVTGLYGRYHRLIRELAARRAPEATWRADLRRILGGLDEDCRKLPHRSGTMLRQELLNQIEHELLGSTNPGASAVLCIALKHLEGEI